jgi:ribonuclease P protein component
VRVEGREGFYVGFSVSRSLHTAAARNRARRWMREAYRLRKSILDPVSVKRANVVFLFSGRGTTHLDHRTRDEIHRFMTALLKELQEQLAANS